MITQAQQQSINAVLAHPHVQRIFALLNANGEELRIVGGAVRNALMDRPIADVDFATTALAPEVMKRAQQAGIKAVATGLEHGTITLVLDHLPYEITTLREDVVTNGRHALVRFGRDFHQDALRRDFTINALSASIDGYVHDYTNGIHDAHHHIVRFIGDPHTRIREDYLRILRFFRFSSDYGNNVLEPHGLQAVIELSQGIKQLSRERIQIESLKILLTKNVIQTIHVMIVSGIAEFIWGKTLHEARLKRLLMQGFTQNNTVQSTNLSISRLAALCVSSLDDALRLREALRLSKAQSHFLEQYARAIKLLENTPLPVDEAVIKRLAYQYGIETTLCAVSAYVDSADCQIEAQQLLRACAQGLYTPPIFPLKGSDLIAAGIPRGPEVSKTLKAIEKRWITQGFPLKKSTSEFIEMFNIKY